MIYSIISFARSRIAVGTSIPSARALSDGVRGSLQCGISSRLTAGLGHQGPILSRARPVYPRPQYAQ
jgi:hypothetical protein